MTLDPTPASPSGKSPTAFRTISEVSADLDVPQHVLRFWESKFPQIKPVKRGGGRRYYRPGDVDLLRRIRTLLYEEGYTIKGVQKLLAEGTGPEAPPGKPSADPPEGAGPPTGEVGLFDDHDPGVGRGGLSREQRRALETLLAELVDIRRILRGE